MFRYGYWPLGLFSYVGNNFEAHKQKAGIYADQIKYITGPETYFNENEVTLWCPFNHDTGSP